MKLLVLGVGNAMCQNCYNTCFAIESAGEYILVDAGGGNEILKRIGQAGIPKTGIRHIFLSHAHTDHILGMPWVIRLLGEEILSGRYQGDLYIHSHDRSMRAFEQICRLTLQSKFVNLFGDRIKLHVISDMQPFEMLGHRFVPFDIMSTKEKQYGFLAFLGSERVMFCGDEPLNPLLEHLAYGCDYLLCEAFCLYRDRDRFKPYEKHHGTAVETAQLAQRVSAKNLVIWHCEDETYDRRTKLYTDEASTCFNGNIFVPRDMDVLTL